MTSAIQQTPYSKIEYPDSDGLPMADNTLQYKWIVTIGEGIEYLFSDDPNVFVAGNLLWYPVEGKPTIRTGPDVLVAFGRHKGERGSYKQWVEGGIAPQVVFEVLSPGNRAGEMKRKFQFYQRYGVEEYYVYNPESGLLQGWRRAASSLEPIPEMNGFVSPRLGIRFEPGKGPDNLKIITPRGKPLQRPAKQLKDDEQRAEAAEQRAAEAERQRAEADQRAEHLAAKLRELGIEPD